MICRAGNELSSMKRRAFLTSLSLLFVLVLTSVVVAKEKKKPKDVYLFKPGVYEAFSKNNRVYMVEAGEALTQDLKDRLVGSSSHSVKGRLPLAKGTRVQLMSAKTFTQKEKRSAATRVEGNKVYYGKATKQKWRYGVARIRILDGKHQGTTGWIKYAQRKMANADGSVPKRTYYTSYLRKPKK